VSSLAKCFGFLLLLITSNTLFAQQAGFANGSSSDQKSVQISDQAWDQADAAPTGGASGAHGTAPGSQAGGQPPASIQPKPSSLSLFGSWRFRAEAWDWFQPAAGRNSYGFTHSLLRAGVAQTRERFDWLFEGAQDAILGLPGDAIAPGIQGQLGLGGTYYVANGNRRNVASGFLKQAYLGIRFPRKLKVTIGRFGFSDGMEVTPADASLAQVVNTRVAQRLIGEFNFSAVLRSFDGVHLSLDSGKSNLTLLAVRPTEGAFQVDAMGELSVDLFYGAYTLPAQYRNGSGELRVFALGYVDQRAGVLKTDNRPLAARLLDRNQVRIGTYGADYAQVLRTSAQGQFDFLLWGALQNGSWGLLTQRAGAFVGELGWQPPIQTAKPWLSAGYSLGSGDSDPTNGRHGTFFQLLPTPRLYARFPFYNMENNEDFYGTAVLRFPRSLVARSEVHALRLADAKDLWYSGGGAFQPATFGYTGRASGASRSLANVWDVSVDFPLRYGFSATIYYGFAWGKGVIANIYPGGTTAQFGYVETNFRF
jgi:alginate export protein